MSTLYKKNPWKKFNHYVNSQINLDSVYSSCTHKVESLQVSHTNNVQIGYMKAYNCLKHHAFFYSFVELEMVIGRVKYEIILSV